MKSGAYAPALNRNVFFNGGSMFILMKDEEMTKMITTVVIVCVSAGVYIENKWKPLERTKKWWSKERSSQSP